MGSRSLCRRSINDQAISSRSLHLNLSIIRSGPNGFEVRSKLSCTLLKSIYSTYSLVFHKRTPYQNLEERFHDVRVGPSQIQQVSTTHCMDVSTNRLCQHNHKESSPPHHKPTYHWRWETFECRDNHVSSFLELWQWRTQISVDRKLLHSTTCNERDSLYMQEPVSVLTNGHMKLIGISQAPTVIC